jgi:hypothetical protein
MKRKMSPQMVEERRKLARLCWTMRSIKRSASSPQELVTQLNTVLAEAGTASQYAKLHLPAGAPVASFRFAIDHSKLQHPEYWSGTEGGSIEPHGLSG